MKKTIIALLFSLPLALQAQQFINVPYDSAKAIVGIVEKQAAVTLVPIIRTDKATDYYFKDEAGTIRVRLSQKNDTVVKIIISGPTDGMKKVFAYLQATAPKPNEQNNAFINCQWWDARITELQMEDEKLKRSSISILAHTKF